MFKIAVDVAKNRLDTMMAAPYTEDELVGLTRELREKVKTLKPGFTVAVDNSQMTVLPEDQQHYLLEAQSILIEAGCGKVTTLLPNAVAKLQVSRVGKQSKLNELSRRFHDRTEWEEWLAEAAD